MMKRSILFVALMAFAALPACGGGDDDGGGTPDSAGGPDSAAGADSAGADGAAALTVAFATDVTTIAPGGEFTISDVVVTGDFTLGDPGAGADGHYHLYIDSTTPAGSYILVDSDTYTGSESAPITWPADGDAATPGAHQLILSLRNDDHSPVDPAVEATVTMTVE